MKIRPKNKILIFVALLVFCGNLYANQDSIYSISLDEATRIAIQNNFDIQLVKYDAWIAQTDKGVAESIYDTIFDAEVKYRNNQRAQTSTLYGTKTLNNDYNVGLSKKLPSGTTLSVDMTNNRNWTDSTSVSNALTHDSALKLTVDQDLGRNFFGIRDRGDVKVTLIDIENTEYTSLDKIEAHIAQLQNAYWDLVLEIERAEIEEEMVAQAKKLYDLQQEKLKDGLVEKPEAIASEANYKQRVDELRLIQNRIDSKIDVLKLLLNLPDDLVLIQPTQNLQIPETIIELTSAVKDALESRRDYKRADNDIQSKKLKLTMKKNNAWPEINLSASLEQNGLGDHFKHAITNITDQNNPDLTAMLTFEFPLENTKARAEMKAAELEKAKALLNLKYIERKIVISVNDQVRNCNVYRELAQSSFDTAELQIEKLKEEEKRFNQGRSNTDTLIRFQEDVLQAKLLAAQAKHRYHTSIVDLELIKGTLLTKYWDEEL